MVSRKLGGKLSPQGHKNRLTLLDTIIADGAAEGNETKPNENTSCLLFTSFNLSEVNTHPQNTRSITIWDSFISSSDRSRTEKHHFSRTTFDYIVCWLLKPLTDTEHFVIASVFCDSEHHLLKLVNNCLWHIG